LNSLDLAQHCDRLGFHRYWVSEHHNTDSIVGTAPEVLMAAIAVSTARIRVGSAGVMLPHYATLKVAEQFRVLEALAPGRIDLGLGQAPGSDQLTAMALNPFGPGADPFPLQVVDLKAWVSGATLDPDHPFAQVKAHPQGDSAPQLWILGSSDYGARLAAYLGLPYAFAYFFSEGRGVEHALDLYRRNVRPSAGWSEPYATICIWALAADTEAQARHLLKTREYWRAGFERGVRKPLISPEEADRHVYHPRELQSVEAVRDAAIAGCADQVAERIRALGRALQLDEIVVNTWTFDHHARVHSYRLLAKAFGLEAGKPRTVAGEDGSSLRQSAAGWVACPTPIRTSLESTAPRFEHGTTPDAEHHALRL
jgi:luciferase family oxidoreductase group 1